MATKSSYIVLATRPSESYAEVHWYALKRNANNFNKSLTNCYHKVISVKELTFCFPNIKREEDGIITTYTGVEAAKLHRLFM